MTKKVMVTGCFDLLHSGHVAFLQEAAQWGALHVCIGSDETVQGLKGRRPVNPQAERQFMLEALACVHAVRVNRGSGILDFLTELDDIQPDVFFVNEDGHTPAKESLCRERGIRYVVSHRRPAGDLPARSTTALRVECTIPYRIDLAGGWLDQPWVSCHCPGPVLTLRHTALPTGDPEQLAKVLFAYENPPGTTEIAGSQDSIGIVFPGLARANYAGHYWPESIESVQDEEVIAWLEAHLCLVTLGPRTHDYDVLADTRITPAGARALADAANGAWEAILRRDLVRLGECFRRSFEAQVQMFPHMADAAIFDMIETYRGQAVGWKLSGAGGGGYLVLLAEKPIARALRITARRRGD
jgi:cytidyltransferase-like protein